jgi:RNA recognition motif-containing protein
MGNKLYVGGLPYSVTEGQLEEIFSQHGTVQSARVISDKFTGRSRGFGFVEMGTDEEAQKAIQALNGTELEGRTLVVNEARPQERTQGGPGGGGGRRPRPGGGRDRW